MGIKNKLLLEKSYTQMTRKLNVTLLSSSLSCDCLSDLSCDSDSSDDLPQLNKIKSATTR